MLTSQASLSQSWIFAVASFRLCVFLSPLHMPQPVHFHCCSRVIQPHLPCPCIGVPEAQTASNLSLNKTSNFGGLVCGSTQILVCAAPFYIEPLLRYHLSWSPAYVTISVERDSNLVPWQMLHSLLFIWDLYEWLSILRVSKDIHTFLTALSELQSLC